MRGSRGRKKNYIDARNPLRSRPFPGELLLSPPFLSFLSSFLRILREKGQAFPFPTRRVTTAEMRSDSGEILRENTSVSYSFSSFPNRSQQLEVIPSIPGSGEAGRSRILPPHRMLISPYCRTRPPRGSPFNIPKCPIYNVVVALPRSAAISLSSSF